MSVTWPPERFFWTTVRSPAWKRDGPIPLGLQAVIADDLPIPTEDLHLVGALTVDDTLVVCAAKREALKGLDPDTASLTPASTPECLNVAINPDRIELLAGDFEPTSSRRARMRRDMTMMATVLTCATLVALGLARRTESWISQARMVAQARAEVSDAFAPGVPYGALDAAVAQMQANSINAPKAPRDAGQTLARVLDGWPMKSTVTPHSITVSDSDINIAVSLEGDPSPFIQSIDPPDGWSLEDPQLNSVGGMTRLSLHMRAGDEP